MHDQMLHGPSLSSIHTFLSARSPPICSSLNTPNPSYPSHKKSKSHVDVFQRSVGITSKKSLRQSISPMRKTTKKRVSGGLFAKGGCLLQVPILFLHSQILTLKTPL